MKLIKTTLFGLLSLAAVLAHAGEIKPYNQAQFDSLIAQGKPVVLEVHANWCPTCRAQTPIIQELMAAPAYKDVSTLVIDFDAEKPLLKQFKVAAQSTLIAFKAGKEVTRSVGVTNKAGIEELVQKTVK